MNPDVKKMLEFARSQMRDLKPYAKSPPPPAGTVLLDTEIVRVVSGGQDPDNPDNLLVTIHMKGSPPENVVLQL